jgi:UDPglucose--hexose-1-phosphate uridylyltransferase
MNEWVLVSPQRNQRPWQGKIEATLAQDETAYDPQCYLCPGNVRAGGVRNPVYSGTFAFDNDFPALLSNTPEVEEQSSPLLFARGEAGICRVVCFSPRHDLSISRMSLSELENVVKTLAAQTESLSNLGWIRHIQIFENRGVLMGASNPHPHCQIWATASAPNAVMTESRSLLEYYRKRDSCLLCDYVQLELKLGQRVVCENDSFVVLVPYWAIWPFETLLISKRHVGRINQLSLEEFSLLAQVLKRTTTKYDNLFNAPFPYSMGFHHAQNGWQPQPEWHFHAHYFPPLLRSASVQKFMVGFELLGTPQRDFTPEDAAVRLRDSDDVHYIDRIAGTASVPRDG